MNLAASFRANYGVLPQCCSSRCCSLQFQPLVATSSLGFGQRDSYRRKKELKLFPVQRKRETFCRVTDAQTEPDGNNDEESGGEDKEALADEPPSQAPPTELVPEATVVDEAVGSNEENKVQFSSQDGDKLEVSTGSPLPGVNDGDKLEVSTGSPLPGVNPLQLDDSMRLPKETIDILKDQVFGFDTFFVTSQEPYEGGVLFKGNLRGQPAKSYEKIKTRLENKFGDQYKLFLLSNPEDDKPVAVVVPRRSLEPETTAVPEWFAAGSFGLVALFTLFLRNVPALQSDLLSAFDNLELLKDGLPGALVTALVLGVHELGHVLVANNLGIKLGVPFFVPSWQIGSFGAITRIKNIVPKREDLLKVAAAGPLAGFSLGFVLFLVGLVVPPSDGIGVVVDSSVFHESFLVGGIAKLLLGDVLKEGTSISLNPLVIWAWAGLLINGINSIPAGELDGGKIAFSIWGRKASTRLTSVSLALLGLSALFSDVAFYWVVLIFFLQRGPIAPLAEEITEPEEKYVYLGILVLFLSLLVCLPYPFAFTGQDAMMIGL
ncbi:probable zinc metalloprotease EGY2, chloroplastic isoform X1 [Brassica rapa]|uniref:probable zinc metalloprotease EGY2, chloroplastic isoform X1 n=1 Tax=Brassica campestris TaxID=3711 RepID=UPI0004F17EF6|nr:probable zinc metalloprotease EGY2, chloroplastic isoform X1 [Brassica rapa]